MLSTEMTSQETAVRYTPAAGAATGAVETVLTEYQARQSETVGLHEQYLRMEEEYARAFVQMTQLQSDLVARLSAAPGEMQAVLPLFESLERSMTRFHDHQAETLRVHQRYMETQEQYTRSFLQGVKGGEVLSALPAEPIRTVTAASRQVPAAASAPVNSNGSGKSSVMPAAPAPAVPAPAAERQPAADRQPATPQTAAIMEPAVIVKPPAAVTPVAPSTASAPDVDRLKAALLSIVSDKTGYPVETLELDMDMEADLGIDSIKRVEILGAMQTQFPELPQIDSTVLAETRTLGQIIDQFNTTTIQASASAPAASAPVASTAAAATSNPAGTATDAGEVTRALLEIVSDKTGYPVETLELDMDMEADLGIDSIKRVEILGAMQTRFPGLPEIESTVLAEMRTLGQITRAMGPGLVAPAEQTPVEEKAAVPTQAATSAPVTAAIDAAAVSAALLEIVSEKTGYPAETLELDMDMEADLGIDSIKRVEILGALQSQFPDLPEVEASEMAELRTLGQITSSLSRAAAAAPSWEVTAQSPFEEGREDPLPMDEIFNPGIEQGIVVRRMLPPPDSMEFSLPEKHVCLIVDDGTAMTTALVQSLREKDWPVVVLRLPEMPGEQHLALPDGAVCLMLEDISEPALETALVRLAEQYGPAAVFIYLDTPGQDRSAEVTFPDEEKARLKLVFLAAKHLKGTLNEAAENGRAAFMVVTRLDGAFGLGEESDFTPVIGGLFGLVKTLNLEWEPVFCRAVDLSPALENAQAAKYILAELHDPNRLISEVGYTKDERTTLAIASVPITGGMK